MRFYWIIRFITRIILSFIFKIKVYGNRGIKDNKGYILAANHQSNFDPALIVTTYKRKVRYMAKEELFKNPFVKTIIKSVGAFPVTRGTGDQGAITKSIEIVQNGGVLGIFPEGTRSKDGQLRRAKSGAVLVASKTGGDIIPVAVKYGKRKFLRREVHIIYGEPIANSKFIINDNSRKDLKAASELLMSEIKALLGDYSYGNIS